MRSTSSSTFSISLSSVTEISRTSSPKSTLISSSTSCKFFNDCSRVFESSKYQPGGPKAVILINRRPQYIYIHRISIYTVIRCPVDRDDALIISSPTCVSGDRTGLPSKTLKQYYRQPISIKNV